VAPSGRTILHNCKIVFLRSHCLPGCRKDATEYVGAITQCLLGPKGTTEKPALSDVHPVMAALLATEALPLMLSHLSKLQFETRKDVVDIFAFACKYENAEHVVPGLEYLRLRLSVIRRLVHGYEDAAIALNCGQMLRDVFSRDARVSEAVITDGALADAGTGVRGARDGEPMLDLFFQYVQVRPAPARVLPSSLVPFTECGGTRGWC
jgi:hypothetical protein